MKLEEYLAEAHNYKMNLYTKIIENSNEEVRKYRKSSLEGIHKEIIKEEAKLIKELVKDKDIEKIFSVYHYLLGNGYFSKKNIFKYKTKLNENDCNLALNVAAGEGCCRNISLHFTKIANEVLGDNRFVLIGTKYKGKPKYIHRTPEISMRIANEKIEKPTNIYLATHMETFDDKTNSVYDPLNFSITRMNYDDISKKYFDGIYDLGIQSVYGSERPSDRLPSLDQRLAKSSLLSLVKKDKKPMLELLELRDEGIEICKDNMDLLKDHQHNLREAYEYVYKKINKK